VLGWSETFGFLLALASYMKMVTREDLDESEKVLNAAVIDRRQPD